MAKNPVHLMKRKMSRTVKSLAFFIAFATILLSMFAAFISTKNNQILQAPQTSISDTPAVEAGPAGVPLPVTLNEMRETNEKKEDEDPLIPPLNASKEERMEWFRRMLPELEVLKSHGLSERFHNRVSELFNRNCSAQFFMIWITPAHSFGKREFMAVDSLFNASPYGCLVILSNSMDSPKGYNTLKPFLDQGFNVRAIAPDLPFLVKGTPAEAWLDELKCGNVDPGSIPLFIHLSDLIRLAVLYKYGGVYLDTDIISLKDFSVLRNTAGAESINKVTGNWLFVNCAVMVFDKQNPLLLNFLREYATTFEGSRWGNNGPRLLSRVLGRAEAKWGYNEPHLVSRVLERVEGMPEYNVTILPPKAFYPVRWIKMAKLFKKPENEEDRKWADETLVDLSSGCYTVHLWNKKSREWKIEEGSVIARLTAEHCNICKNIYDT